jgi:hypothetical protein
MVLLRVEVLSQDCLERRRISKKNLRVYIGLVSSDIVSGSAEDKAEVGPY